MFAADAPAQSQVREKRIEQAAVQFAEAYRAKNLSVLDAARLIRGSVKVVIGYASADETEIPDTIRRFPSFRALQLWLADRSEKGVDNPNWYVQKNVSCLRGRCSFDDDEGSLHNRLYLSEIVYGYRNGRPFIKEIHLWNGD